MEIRQGSIKIERVLGVLLLTILMGYFVYISSGMAEHAEKMNIQNRVRLIQTAIDLEFATLMMENKQQQAEKWLGKNPFTFLQKNIQMPSLDNLIPYQQGLQPTQIKPGKWYFNESEGVTYYHVINTDLVGGNLAEKGVLAWKITPKIILENDLTRKSQKTRIEGVYFKPLYDFHLNY